MAETTKDSLDLLVPQAGTQLGDRMEAGETLSTGHVCHLVELQTLSKVKRSL